MDQQENKVKPLRGLRYKDLLVLLSTLPKKELEKHVFVATESDASAVHDVQSFVFNKSCDSYTLVIDNNYILVPKRDDGSYMILPILS